MSYPVTTGDGVTFNLPEAGDANWGTEVTNYLIHMAGAAFAPTVNTTTKLIVPTLNGVVSAGGIISTTVSTLIRVSGDGSAVTLSLTTPLNNGTQDGEFIIVMGGSDTNTVTINDAGNVDLRGPITLGTNQAVTLIWSAVAGKWVEISRNN